MKAKVSVHSLDGFLVFVPHFCHLTDEAGELLAAAQGADFVFGDSFHYSKVRDSKFTFQIRPGWSPERLRGHCYVGDVVAASPEVVERAGGQEFLQHLSSHDRALRLSETATSPMHVAKLLYTSPLKRHMPSVDLSAVVSHCERVGISATCTLVEGGKAVQVMRHRAGNPKVCAIIPTRGTVSSVGGKDVVLAAHAIRALCQASTYPELEFLVVADLVTPAQALEEITNATNRELKIIPFEGPFNFSQKINRGAVHTDAEYLLLMNDDTEVVTSDIIETMLSHFEDSSVGQVGPLLTYEDGTIQSAGHICNPVPFDLYRGEPFSEDVGFGMLGVAREVSSVIAAFTLTPRSVFLEVGGLCEEFPGDYNDLDYAFKLKLLGYKTIFTPFATCKHFESKTRVAEFDNEAIALLGKRWQHLIENDEYGNPYLMKYASIWITNVPTLTL